MLASTRIIGRRSILTLATSTLLVRPLLLIRSTVSPADSSERYRVFPFADRMYDETGPAFTLNGREFTGGFGCTSPSIKKSACEEEPVNSPSPASRISVVSTQTRDPVPMSLIPATRAVEREMSSESPITKSLVLRISLMSWQARAIPSAPSSRVDRATLLSSKLVVLARSLQRPLALAIRFSSGMIFQLGQLIRR